MSAADWIIILIIAAAAGLALRSIIKRKKSGKCSCGCEGCSGCDIAKK